MSEPDLHATRRSVVAGYGIMLAGSALALWGIQSLGSTVSAPPPGAGATFGQAAHAAHPSTLPQVLLALLVVVGAARLLGAIFRRLEQPAVVGEVIAGIALGPSLLGRFAPSVAAYVLPSAVVPSLNIIAQVGVILFMFLVGLELDTRILRDKAHSALAISHASIIAPFLLGALTAVWIYPRLSTHDVPFTLFALFMGVAMSITAFPVLARILTDRGMHKSKLGVIALSCAAVDDVTAWCLLSLVVSMASPQGGQALLTFALTVSYIAVCWFVFRPLVVRWVQAQDERQELGKHATALMIVGMIASALLTEYIGIHAIFGAFLLGALVPSESLLAHTLKTKFEELVLVLLLPAYFAVTGLRTQIGLLDSAEHWLMCLAIIGVACAGKFGGTYFAARASGLDGRDAASLGALMNTRGLMELVVLNLGLDLGVVSPTLFAMMVVMAIVTTFATTPLLALFSGRSHAALGALPAEG